MSHKPKAVDATIKGKMPNGNTSSTHIGETPGVGQINSAVLVERPFTSNPRNQGPNGEKSMNTELPIVTTGARKTGRLYP